MSWEVRVIQIDEIAILGDTFFKTSNWYIIAMPSSNDARTFWIRKFVSLVHLLKKNELHVLNHLITSVLGVALQTKGEAQYQQGCAM
jgi:hypothetical protein